MAHRLNKLEQLTRMGLGRFNRLTGTWSPGPVGKLVHLQMTPNLYLSGDKHSFWKVKNACKEQGRSYRGY